MRAFWRGVFLTAGYELTDLMRSRRVAVVLLLYVAGLMLGCHGFLHGLQKIEAQLSETLHLPAAASTGTVTEALWQSRAFRRMVTGLVGDRQVALDLFSVPPIVVIYGWLAFTFTPVYTVLASAPRIAEEIDSGSARFVLVRTGRLAWCLGKYAGQALELLFALTLGALGVWCIARFRMVGVADPVVVAQMIGYAWRAWLYGLAFAGLGLGISQVVRPMYLAMGAGFGAWVAVSVLWLISRHVAGEGAREAWEVVQMLVPMGHRLDLWRADWLQVGRAGVFLGSLGFAYFLAGYAGFARKSL